MDERAKRGVPPSLSPPPFKWVDVSGEPRGQGKEENASAYQEVWLKTGLRGATSVLFLIKL